MLNNFSGGHWGQCLESLSHLCEYSDDILLVSGPSGIGKSTMKNVLATQESDKFMVCKISATCDITPESLTQCIDLECDKQTNKELLLLIDDAQNLSLDVVTLLLRLKKKTAVSGLLHIVLFATSELEEKISFSVLKDDFFVEYEVVGPDKDYPGGSSDELKNGLVGELESDCLREEISQVDWECPPVGKYMDDNWAQNDEPKACNCEKQDSLA